MHRLTRRSVLGAGLALPFLHKSASAREPGTLIFGLSSYPPSLSPWNNTGTASVSVKLQIYRGLISYDANGNLRGELAESWKPDGETGWLFTLRDAVFQNGAQVTPEDVKWTIEQVAAEKSTAYLRTEFQRVDRIETPDAKTVRIILKSPSAVLPELLASPHMPIIARGTTDPGQTPIGAGPYVLKAQERGVSLDLVAFDKYYRPGLPKTKSLRFVAYADEDLRVAALRSGDIDLIEYVPWQAMKAIEADPKLALQTVRGPFMALSFNGARGPFKDPLVRSAVAFAIKREDIVQAAFYGRGAPLEGLPISPSSPFYDDSRAHYWRYDPAHAKALARPGWPAQRLHHHAAFHRAVRHAQIHRRNRPAAPRRHRHPVSRSTCRIGPPASASAIAANTNSASKAPPPTATTPTASLLCSMANSRRTMPAASASPHPKSTLCSPAAAPNSIWQNAKPSMPSWKPWLCSNAQWSASPGATKATPWPNKCKASPTCPAL